MAEWGFVKILLQNIIGKLIMLRVNLCTSIWIKFLLLLPLFLNFLQLSRNVYVIWNSWQILMIKVSKWPYWSARHDRVIIGSLSGHYQVIIKSLSGHYWVIIGSLLGHYQVIIGSLSGHYHVIIGSLSSHYQVIIGSLLGDYQVIIGLLSGHCWVIIG